MNTTVNATLDRLWQQAEGLGLSLIQHLGPTYRVNLSIERQKNTQVSVVGNGDTINEALQNAIDEAIRLGESHEHRPES